MGENRWRGFDHYPVPAGRVEAWHLHPDGGLRRALAPPSRPDRFQYYTSAVLDAPYTVIGAVWVTLFAASSAADTDFVARLVDVHPMDARSIWPTGSSG